MGTALRHNPPAGVDIFAPGREMLDLSNLPDLGPMLDGVTAIVNCGAYTAVDKAESEPQLAALINAEAPAKLAIAAESARIPLIHVSTDYVFSPTGSGPWTETSPVAPGNAYGMSKLAGERAIGASGARHAVIRTAWVVSADGSNFIKTMLRLGAERDELRVVADQRGCPTHAGDLAMALAQIAARFVADPAQPSGIWHCTNAGETTWHALAKRIFARAGALGLKVPARLEPIPTAEYPTPAERPVDSRLDCGKIARDFGVSLRPWQEAVDAIVSDLAQREQAE